MSGDKQIEEMARKICPCIYDHNDCESCDLYEHESCLPFNIARELADNNYRKASEVARNIFVNLRILGHIDFEGNMCVRKDSFEELEKKYTEGRE